MMQTRPSISYQSLKEIMTRDVKRGPLRSLLGDRDHTTQINTLLDCYINENTISHGHLPIKVDHFSELNAIFAFHRFTIQFNEIMQKPLKGKSSAAAASAVEVAINTSQQKYLADAWAPFLPLFDEDFFNSLQINKIDYDHYIHYLIPFIKTIITPKDSFNLNLFLQTISRDAYYFLEVVYALMRKSNLENNHPIKSCIARIQGTTQDNQHIAHTLKLAEFFNAFKPILESDTVKRLNAQLGPMNDGKAHAQCIQWLTVMFCEVHTYFDVSNQHIYQEAMQHFLNAAARFKKDIYSELITPDFFKLDRLLKLRSLTSAIVATEQPAERCSNWLIETAFYIHFKFFNKDKHDKAFLMSANKTTPDAFYPGINWQLSSLSLEENSNPNLPPRLQSLAKNPDDFIDFLEILVNHGLTFFAAKFLGELTSSDRDAGLLFSQARHERAIQAHEDGTFQPALFGDIITSSLFVIAYGDDQDTLENILYRSKSFFSTLNQLSKIKSLLTEKLLHAVSAHHSLYDPSLQQFIECVHRFLKKEKSLNPLVLFKIIHHVFVNKHFSDIYHKIPLLDLIIRLNDHGYPLETEFHVNTLLKICGFSPEINRYLSNHSGISMLGLVTRLSPACTTLIMDELCSHFRLDNTFFASPYIEALDKFSLDFPDLLTEANIRSLFTCDLGDIRVIFNVFRALMPELQPCYTPILPHDHPNQPNTVFIRMTQHYQRISVVLPINRLYELLLRIPEHIKSPALLSTIINLALDNEAEQAAQLIRAQVNAILPRDEHHQAVQPFNDAQSTHTRSVHKTVSKSAIRLKSYFGDRIDIMSNLEQLEEELRDHVEGTKQFENDSNPERKLAFLRYYSAHQAVISIRTTSMGQYQDPQSKMSIRELLAIAYECLRTPDIRTFYTPDGNSYIADESDARERLYDKLYEGERNYNLDADDVDDGKLKSRRACQPGMFNKIMEAMYTVVNCVKIIMLTKEYALKKLQYLINRAIIGMLKNEPRNSTEEKTAFHALLNKLKIEGASLLTDLIINDLYAQYHFEFSPLYQNDAGTINFEAMMRDVRGGVEAIDIDPLLIDCENQLKIPSIVNISIFQPLTTTPAPEANTEPENRP